MLRSEVFRLRRRRMPRLLLGALVASVILAYGIGWFIIRQQPFGLGAGEPGDLRSNLQLTSARAYGLGVVQTLTTLLVILLTAIAIGSEYRWGTIRALLPRAHSRSAFLTAKLLVSVLFTALLVAAGYLTALLASLVTSALEGWPLGLGPNWFVRTAGALACTGYVILPYLGLAFLVTIWTRSTLFGAAVAIGLFAVEVPVIALLRRTGGPLHEAPDLLLRPNVNALLHLNNRGTGLAGGATNLPNPWLAAVILAAYAIAFVSLGYWRFHRRDITVK